MVSSETVFYGVGFSTTDALTSRAIRWLGKSEASHAVLFLPSPSGQSLMVMEADSKGVRVRSFSVWKARNQLVEVYVFGDQGRAAGVMESMLRYLGHKYDTRGLIGFLWVMLGRAFGKRWKNPFASIYKEVCSELVAVAVSNFGISGVPGGKALDPERASPEDVRVLCEASDLATLKNAGGLT